jgi:hypothetical protein
MTDTTPSRGKIGALPHRLREQVNHRLLDGQVDSEILPWLNALPEVQERMKARFKSEPISSMNLSAWRTGQYQIWLAERQEIAATKELAEFSEGLADAAGIRLSAGAKAIATGRIMQRLQAMGEGTELEALLDTVKAIKDLHKGDIDAEKIGLERTKVEQAERTLVLAEDKFRRETADLILQHIKDTEVQRIAASKESQTVKMDQLILHIWGKRPDQPAAPVPAPRSQ